jgi:hypothetical protein
MHNSLKIIKTLLYFYSALHVSGTLVSIIRNLLTLHIQPSVTVCRWVGCIFQLWSVARNNEANICFSQLCEDTSTHISRTAGFGPNLALCYCETVPTFLSTAAIMAILLVGFYTVRRGIFLWTVRKRRIL